jgi:hypothetical protein
VGTLASQAIAAEEVYLSVPSAIILDAETATTPRDPPLVSTRVRPSGTRVLTDPPNIFPEDTTLQEENEDNTEGIDDWQQQDTSLLIAQLTTQVCPPRSLSFQYIFFLYIGIESKSKPLL